LNSKDLADGITAILKDYKEYKVQEKAIVISAENYTIVQIKKNIDEFLAGNLTATPTQPNWDGSFEKPIVQQEQKPVQSQDQPKKEVQNKQQNNQPVKPSSSGMEGQDSEFGLPPSPQMGTPGKKG